MDNLKLLLFVALAFVLLMIWQAWEQDHGTRRAQLTAAAPSASPSVGSAEVPSLPKSAESSAPARKETETEQRVHVVTDVLNVEIGARGGDLLRVDLLRYPVSLRAQAQPVRLMNDRAPHFFIAQSGILSAVPSPSHRDLYTVDHSEYRLQDGRKELKVVLHWRGPSGTSVDKVYTFRRGSYLIEVSHVLHNDGSQPWPARVYGQFQRTEWKNPKESSFIHTFTGGAFHTAEDRYRKVSFSEMSSHEIAMDSSGGWAAMLEHYFVSAWVPPGTGSSRFYARALEGGRYLVGTIGPEVLVAPGHTSSVGMRLYVGPKIQSRLEQAAPGLELTVDYGIFWFLSQPLYWLLDHIHYVVGNWGWAIILLTVLIKLAFFHLSATSYRSMANMRRLQPRLAELKERYGDDRQRMSQAMMELYKREKVNPLGGCLPIVVQIPVFIALYWVLVESVELRQAPFIAWIRDLSVPDPYYVLPVLMGVTMLVQQWLNPNPVDPLQKKVMMAMPLVFTVFFAFFPAGLVLYWTTNNALSIAQQWHITRRIERSTS
jgi:YidC/Oxa1 family membrane protein insertase